MKRGTNKQTLAVERTKMGRGAVLALLLAVVVGVGVFYFQTQIVEDPAWEHTLTLDGSSIKLKRNPTNGGMFEIEGKDHLDYARALGTHPPRSTIILK
jgi:hypothetical protein